VIVIKPELEVRILGVLGDIGRLLEPHRERLVVNILAEDLRSWGFRRWAPVLPTIVVTALARVVATAGTVLLVPLARVENIARVVVVANAIMDG
jgi:hypothetical protein